MGKPYSEDLRERVVEAIEAGHTREEVAELFRLSLSTVGRLVRRKRETGSIRAGTFSGTAEITAGMSFEYCRRLFTLA